MHILFLFIVWSSSMYTLFLYICDQGLQWFLNMELYQFKAKALNSYDNLFQ